MSLTIQSFTAVPIAQPSVSQPSSASASDVQNVSSSSNVSVVQSPSVASSTQASQPAASVTSTISDQAAKAAVSSQISDTQVVSGTSTLSKQLQSDEAYQKILQEVSRIDELLKTMEGNNQVSNTLSNALNMSGTAQAVPGMTQTESLAYSIYSSGTSQKDVERWLNSEVQRDPALASMLLNQKEKYSFQQQFMVDLQSTLKETGTLVNNMVKTVNDPSATDAQVMDTAKAFVDRYNQFMQNAATQIEQAGKEKADGLKINHAYFAVQRDTSSYLYAEGKAGEFNELADIGITTDEATGVLRFDADKFKSSLEGQKGATLDLLRKFSEAYSDTVATYSGEEGELQHRIDNIQQGLDWLNDHAPALQNMSNAKSTQNSTVRVQMSLYAQVSYMQ